MSIQVLSNVFTETLEQAIDSVVVINADNNVIFYNQAAEQLWGYPKNDVLGHNVKILVPQDIRPQHDNLINKNRSTGVNKIVGTSREVPIICKDGTRKWGSMSISKIHSNGDILYTAFIKEVTESVATRKRLELLSLVTDQTDNAIVIVDKNWQTVYTNQGFSRLFGFTEQEMLGSTPISIIAPHLNEGQAKALRQQHIDGKAIKRDEILQGKTGESFWCSIMSNPVFNQERELTHVVIVLSEITKTKLHEILHQEVLGGIVHDKPLESIMDSACNEITRLDESIIPAIFTLAGEYLQLLSAPYLPKDLQKIFNKIPFSEEHLPSNTTASAEELVICKSIYDDSLCIQDKAIVIASGFKSTVSVPIKNSRSESIGIITFFSKKELTDLNSQIDLINVLAPLCTLAIEREKQRENIRKLAYYDTLTTLPNRSLLIANAEHAIKEAHKNETKLAFLFIDVDRFKQINDSFGHPVGDEFLINIAQRITPSNDLQSIVGRLSGDEFVIMTSYQSADELNTFIEELKLRVMAPMEIKENSISPSISIGVSTFPSDGYDVGTLIHRADMAMYQAKSLGKGRFTYFSHELNEQAQELQILEIELEEAIAHNHLTLHFQPQLSMKDGSVMGVEALCRWTHSKLGVIPPSKFIPIAEECGLIGKLSEWVLHTACKQLSFWKKNNINIPVISVNLSPINFHNVNLTNIIMNELESFDLKPSELILELTENVLLDTNPSTLKVLNEIHDMGIHFSMDDFGTGYSSLSYLQKIPIKELKLDRSFVEFLEIDSTSRALSQAVLQIGESLNINVVAEGIENDEQYKILKDQGYHIAQGYLFSKPLSANEIEDWLDNK